VEVVVEQQMQALVLQVDLAAAAVDGELVQGEMVFQVKVILEELAPLHHQEQIDLEEVVEQAVQGHLVP
jgi:hypothetical protein